MEQTINHTASLDLKTTRNDSIDFTFGILDEENEPVNFSGYTGARLSIKGNEYSNSVATFTSTGATYQIDMSGKAIGEIRIVANDTTAIGAGKYVYDLELYNATKRETVVAGKITVVPDIS